jgi:hypothetical protein
VVNILDAMPRIDLFDVTDGQWDDWMALKLHTVRLSMDAA